MCKQTDYTLAALGPGLQIMFSEIPEQVKPAMRETLVFRLQNPA